MTELVWYASYGSNLLRNRFMCYIRGGKPEGSSKEYEGCSSNNPPRDDRPIIIPHELYFSKQSSTWKNKAVAFIKSQRNEKARTLGRMYLIEKQQFVEVVRQENSYNRDDSEIDIDFETVIERGEVKISKISWYGRIIYLGNERGYPIFTFTAKWDDDQVSSNEPGEKYLRTIIKGLKETYNLSNDEIVDYLKDVDGIRGKINELKIKKIIEVINFQK